MKSALGVACELAGLAGLSFACYMVLPWLGLLVASVAVIVIGLAIGGEK